LPTITKLNGSDVSRLGGGKFFCLSLF
jgi:hypothetical protein